MPEVLRSFAVGTLGLTLTLLVCVVVVLVRPGTARWDVAPVRKFILATAGLHVVHLFEETINGFQVRFPELLGLSPWPTPLFLTFNFIWLAFWVAGSFVATAGRSLAVICYFLAIASMLNAIAHVGLCVATGGYFPGVWTAPVFGVAGFALYRGLQRATRRDRG